METTKSAYSIRLELPSYVTVIQCQELLDQIFQNRIVRDAIFVIESSNKEERFIFKNKLAIQDEVAHA